MPPRRRPASTASRPPQAPCCPDCRHALLAGSTRCAPSASGALPMPGGTVRLFPVDGQAAAGDRSRGQFGRVGGPDVERVLSCVAIGTGGEAVPAWAEDGGCLIVHRQEPLGMSRRLEPTHDLLSSAGVPVRCFGRVVDPLVPAMCDTGGEFRLRGRIGSELVGHHHPRQAQRLKSLRMNRLAAAAARLHEDVQHVAVRVDRSPQPVSDAADLRTTSSKCHCRLARARRMNCAPNFATQVRIVSQETTIPRSARRSSTSRRLRAKRW